MTPDSTRRFSDRVENYVRYRPGYPKEILEALCEEIGLRADWIVADVGSGTGLSCRMFLESGNRVIGVEPNAEMRAAGEKLLRGFPGFESVDGTAEATTLADRSVDLVVAGQACHWFDPERAREEFRRVLKPGGWAALIWNTRRMDTTPFLRAYEALLVRFGTDYTEVGHRSVRLEDLRRFFKEGFRRRLFYNEQLFDLEMLEGRLLSSSYAPAAGHPDHEPMLRELGRIFAEHQEEERVRFEYDTELYLGRLG